MGTVRRAEADRLARQAQNAANIKARNDAMVSEWSKQLGTNAPAPKTKGKVKGRFSGGSASRVSGMRGGFLGGLGSGGAGRYGRK
jgi:hypothetical protein